MVLRIAFGVAVNADYGQPVELAVGIISAQVPRLVDFRRGVGRRVVGFFPAYETLHRGLPVYTVDFSQFLWRDIEPESFARKFINGPSGKGINAEEQLYGECGDSSGGFLHEIIF